MPPLVGIGIVIVVVIVVVVVMVVAIAICSCRAFVTLARTQIVKVAPKGDAVLLR